MAGPAGPQLRQAADIGAGDMAKLGIAAGGRVIGHQHQRLFVPGDLDGAQGNAVGDDIVAPAVSDRRAIQPVGHAVAGRDLEGHAEEEIERRRVEIIVLRADNDPQRRIKVRP